MSFPKLVPIVPLALVSFLQTTGCDQPDPISPIDGAVIERVALTEALGLDSVNITGVTLDPNTGDRYVLDAWSGIWKVDAEGAQQTLALQDFPAADVDVWSEWYDFAAMGDGKFAMIAVGDGYLLDTEAETLSQWFCYEPGWMDPEFAQESHNLAYDPGTDRIFSAPLTRDADWNVDRADVATFDGAGAGDLSWFPLADVDQQFGGMALDPDGTVLLGFEDTLYTYEMGDAALTVVGSLAEHGIEVIAGMSVDAETGNLHVIDGADAELVVIQR